MITSFRQGWPRFSVPKQAFERGSRDVSIALSTGRIEGNVAAPFAADESIQLKWIGPALSAQATAIHEMFVNTLVTSSGSYAATEAANAAAAG